MTASGPGASHSAHLCLVVDDVFCFLCPCPRKEQDIPKEDRGPEESEGVCMRSGSLSEKLRAVGKRNTLSLLSRLSWPTLLKH